MRSVLVTAKVNPDLDGTACVLAYAELLNKTGAHAEGYVFGQYQSEVKYFVEKHDVQIPVKEAGYTDEWDNFVLVDASSMKGMPSVVRAEKVIEIIDHRNGSPEKEFPQAKIQNDLIGAAATIIVERFKKAKILPSKEYALLLYGAIFHNTLNFIATNSSQRDKNAATFLENNFSFKKSLIKEMFIFFYSRNYCRRGHGY